MTLNGIQKSTIIIDGKKVPLLKIPPRMSGIDNTLISTKKRKPTRLATENINVEEIFEEPTEDYDTKIALKDALEDYHNTGEINDYIDDIIDPLNPWGINENQLFDNY